MPFVILGAAKQDLQNKKKSVCYDATIAYFYVSLINLCLWWIKGSKCDPSKNPPKS